MLLRRSLPPRAPLVPLALLLLASPSPAQPPARHAYLDYVPPATRIVGQAAASARLHLYGDTADPTYRDVDPVDGIDDARGRRLLALAERFSPLLRRNNYSVPRDFEAVLAPAPRLHADEWREGALVRSLDLDLRVPPAAPADGANGAAAGASGAAGAAVDDRQLDSLLRALHPRRARPAVVRPEGESEHVLFFDFPGSDERSWRAAYGEGRPRAPSRAYAHFFVHEACAEEPGACAPGVADAARLALVVQFWLFYPFNDGPNNHEGDWEHLNVVLTTRAAAADPARVDGRLDEAELAHLLRAEGGTPLDSLALAMVDYYFHHSVVTLRYVDPPASGAAHAAPEAETHNRVWQDGEFVRRVVRRRQELAGGRLATHPVGFIGGNNMGPDELLTLRPRFRGSFGRNSHGTYPFPAVWRTIGPMNATEKVFGDVVPRVRGDPAAVPDSAWHELVDDPYYVVYRADDLVLVPDWERVQDLVLADAAARRRWAWLLLPIRFGFPTAPSPGGGVVKRIDLGNVSPLGPAYHVGWNRLGRTSEHHPLDPQVLRVALAPVTPWTSLQSGWGVLNAPLAALGLMPGYNVVLTQLLPWMSGVMSLLGAPPAKTVYPGQLPTRVTSFGAGGYYQFGGHDFARLLPQRDDPAVASFLTERPDAFIDADSYRRGRSAGMRLWGSLYYGLRFSVENTFSMDTTEVRYTLRGGDGLPVGLVQGRLSVKELGAAFVFRPIVGRDRPVSAYLRGGYGWTWYRVRDMTLNGAPLERTSGKGGYAPTLLPSKSWWPNTWQGGVGVELFAPKRLWLMQRLGYGVRLEGTGLLHRLSSRETCGPRCDATVGRTDGAVSMIFGW